MARVLVIDDEASIRLMLKETLEQDGHKIVEALNGEEALKMFGLDQFDLVITDLVMPRKNGIDLIMDIKHQAPNSRIIAISGGGGMSGRFDYLPIAELVGADAILSKPFMLQELKDTVSQILAPAS